jgi:hypothetical protein
MVFVVAMRNAMSGLPVMRVTIRPLVLSGEGDRRTVIVQLAYVELKSFTAYRRPTGPPRSLTQHGRQQTNCPGNDPRDHR